MGSHFSTGLFLISLDFELYWGVRDKRSLKSYAENLHRTREAVLAMLALFEEYEVHATWSTVGLLFLDNRRAAIQNIPAVLPGYHDQNLCPYSYLKRTERLDPEAHFAADLIQSIARTPGQEIGSHTFSHFYCLESGVSEESFSADLQRAAEVGQATELSPRSLVFPRNQWREDFLSQLPRFGMTCFRGVEEHPVYAATPNADQDYFKRGVRLLDSYINLTGHHAFGPDRCGNSPPFNLPASRFLRAYSRKLKVLEALKKRRILASMRYAAEKRQAFHLWWHPHNFGSNLRANLKLLESILTEYRNLARSRGMRSLTMAETSEELLNETLA